MKRLTGDNFRLSSVFDGLVLALLALASTTAFLSFRNLDIDDAFITYRIAWNAAHGLGLVYNQGEQVMVSTTPLFTLVLATIAIFYSDLPTAGSLISAIGLFGSASFLYLLTRSSLGAFAGFIAATVCVSLPLVLLTLGMETTTYLMFATGALYFYFSNRLTASAIFLALLLLTRPDGILLAVVIFAHYLVRHHRFPMREVGLFGAISAPWFIFAQLYYGSPLPATLQAKMAHGQSLWWPKHFVEGGQDLLIEYYRENPLFLLFGLIGILGLLIAIKNAERWRALLEWTLLYAAGYTFLHVPNYNWYYVPLVPAIAVAIATGITHVPQGLLLRLGSAAGGRLKALPPVIAFLLFVLLASALARFDFRIASALPLPVARVYKEAGLWIRNNTPPDASAAMIEIGIVGYQAQRRIIDIVGLTHPDTARQMATTDAAYAIRRYSPDYVLLGATIMPDVQAEPWFGERYVPRKFIQHAGYGPGQLLIFGKTDGSRPPEQRTVQASFENVIELRSYSMEPAAVRPGEGLRVSLQLQQLQSSSKIIGGFAVLVDKDGRGVFQKDTTLRPESWKEGKSSQHFDIYVPLETPAGRYEVQTGLYYLPAVEELRVIQGSGTVAGRRLQLGPVKVTDGQGIANPGHEARADFGGKISLLGYDAATSSDGRKRQLIVNLAWQARAPVAEDLTVFVHLLDVRGQVVAQHDGQPRSGNYPTSIWDAGEIVVDRHVVELDDSLAGGEYQIAVGMYYGPTGRRLDARSESAQIKDNAVLAGTIRFP